MSDPPLEEHAEGVLAQARLLLEDLLLEHQPLAVAAVLFQGLADEVQACWRRDRHGLRLHWHPGLASDAREGALLWGPRDARRTRVRQYLDPSNQEPFLKTVTPRLPEGEDRLGNLSGE